MVESMRVLRILAAADVATRHAHAQLVPRRAEGDALLAALGPGRDRLDLAEVPAGGSRFLHASAAERYLGFDFHRYAEGELGHSDGRPRVPAALRPVQLDDQLGEAVDDGGLIPEAGRRVHHAEHAQPSRYAVEIAELALQAAENRKPRETRAELRLL